VTETPSSERLYVCTGSGESFGLLSYEGGPPTHEQRCLNSKCPYREEAWHRPQTDLPHPPGHSPTELELCYCCASEIIQSGPRWSSFFCEPCRVAVVGLKNDLGFPPIPLGRHSIMNGLALTATAARDPRQAAAFVTATRSLFDRSHLLCDWRRVVIADRGAAMHRDTPYVSVPAYLAFSYRHALPKAEMFRQLCRYFGVEPVPAGAADMVNEEFDRVRDIAIAEARRWAAATGVDFGEFTYREAIFLFADDCYHTSIVVRFVRDGRTYTGELHARIGTDLRVVEGSDSCDAECISAEG